MHTAAKKSLLLEILEGELAVGGEHDVGVERYPLAQHDDGRHIVIVVDACDVDVAVDECLDVGVLGVVVARVVDQVGGGALRDGALLLGVAAGAVLVRPAGGDGIGPAGMDTGIEPLAHLIIETPAREAVHRRLHAHVVAMGDEHALAACHDLGVAIEDGQADLVAQVIEEPHVVVAGDPGDFHARVGKFGEFTQETDVAAGHDILVFIPIVQDVAQQKQLGGIVLDAVQKAAHATFPLQRVTHVLGAQVQVRDEICLLSFQLSVFSLKPTSCPARVLPRRSSCGGPTRVQTPG